MSKEIRLIKKYPNRRLYDTAISGYITVADVKQMIIDFVEIQVVDAKTGEDLTVKCCCKFYWKKRPVVRLFSIT